MLASVVCHLSSFFVNAPPRAMALVVCMWTLHSTFTAWTTPPSSMVFSAAPALEPTQQAILPASHHMRAAAAMLACTRRPRKAYFRRRCGGARCEWRRRALGEQRRPHRFAALARAAYAYRNPKRLGADRGGGFSRLSHASQPSPWFSRTRPQWPSSPSALPRRGRPLRTRTRHIQAHSFRPKPRSPLQACAPTSSPRPPMPPYESCARTGSRWGPGAMAAPSFGPRKILSRSSGSLRADRPLNNLTFCACFCCCFHLNSDREKC